MKKLLFFLPALILIASCDKDDDDDQPAGKTKTELITQTSWKFEKAGIDNDKNGTIDQDLSSQINACVKDNTLKFETNNTGVSDEGGTKCSTNSPQSLPFTWSFASNETAVNITGNAVLGFGGQYKIITLSETNMSLSKDTTLPIIGASTVVAQFIH